MKDSKKIKYNLIAGMLGQVVTVVLGILLPRLVLNNFGSEINGLLSSVTNIYAYIAIVEAGVAAASCQALYRAISEKNVDQTNRVMAATNAYYHRTGIIYLGLIMLFSVVYPAVIETEISYCSVALIVLFNGIGNVVTYFFHGKYLILLKADGKNYVRTSLELLSGVIKQIGKIILISLGYDIVVVQIIAMLASIFQMLIIVLYVRKTYSWIDLSVEPDFASISQSKHVFAHEINYLVTSNVDVVLLTVFTTLKTVSVYSLYVMLFGMVTRVLRIVKDALEFKIAHEFHRCKRSFLEIFGAYEVYYIAFAFSLLTIVHYFILPFLKLYTSGVTDINYIDNYLPFLFVLINLLSAGRYPSDAMIHISGHFEQTKKSAIAETLINVVVSIALVRSYGIIGVLIGTVISSLYRTNYLICYVNRTIINRSPFVTYKCWLINFVVCIGIICLSGGITVALDSYMRVFLFCIPYSIGVLVIFFVINSVCMPNAFSLIRRIIRDSLNING